MLNNSHDNTKKNSIATIEKTLRQNLAVILYFYNDHCPPCISLRPKVENLINEKFPKIKIMWIDSLAHPEIPAKYGVFANPAILLFFEGREFKRFSKYISIPELTDAIDRYYSLAF